MSEHTSLDDDQIALIEAWSASVRKSHDERVEAIVERLEPREAAIMRESAVMGFVQGVMFAGRLHDVQIPPDRDIVYRTLDGIGGMPEIYPTLTGGGDV